MRNSHPPSRNDPEVTISRPQTAAVAADYYRRCSRSMTTVAGSCRCSPPLPSPPHLARATPRILSLPALKDPPTHHR